MTRLSLAFAVLLVVIAAGGCATSQHAASARAGHRAQRASASHPASAPATGKGSVGATQAIAAASRDTTLVSSFALTESVTLHGLPAVASGVTGVSVKGAVRLTMREQMRLRPSLLAAATIHMTIAGHALAIDEIMTPHALYLKAPGLLPPSRAKPWTEVRLASLPNGMTLRKLFAQAQGSAPFSQLGSPQALAKLLKLAQHVRVDSHQVVGGVSVTEYSGVISLRHIITLMPAADRKLFGSADGVGISGPFRVWIDARHYLRRMVLKLRLGKISMLVRVDVTAINQPVSVVPPRASQVAASGQ